MERRLAVPPAYRLMTHPPVTDMPPDELSLKEMLRAGWRARRQLLAGAVCGTAIALMQVPGITAPRQVGHVLIGPCLTPTAIAFLRVHAEAHGLQLREGAQSDVIGRDTESIHAAVNAAAADLAQWRQRAVQIIREELVSASTQPLTATLSAQVAAVEGCQMELVSITTERRHVWEWVLVAVALGGTMGSVMWLSITWLYQTVREVIREERERDGDS